MNKYIATFGCGQVNEGYFVRITCDNRNQATEFMDNEYKGKYCMVYSEEQWIDWTIHAMQIGIETEKYLKDHILL